MFESPYLLVLLGTVISIVAVGIMTYFTLKPTYADIDEV